MAHIVIIGAGTGGTPAAYEMKAAVGKAHEVTVINTSDHFQFIPSNPWVGVGWRKRADITFPLEQPFKNKGINFIVATVTHIDSNKKTLTLDNNNTVDYDYLLIATGPKLAFDEISGLGPHDGFTHSICNLAHSEIAHDGYQQLLENPGPVVVGAVQGASCYGPAYEYSMIVDTALKKAKRRKDVPMTYVTSEPYVGHMGLGGVGDSKGLLESELRERHIKWITNAKVTKVEEGKMFIDQCDENGETIKQYEEPFHYSMMLPAFKGVDPVAAVPELCNPRGFVIVDKYQRNPKHPNIYAVGVCIAIPPIEKTPLPVGAPKTGFMIETMVTAAVHNIKADIEGKEPHATGTWNAICLADMGSTGAAFVAMPQIPPRNVTWTKRGKWVHVAKIAFEKYFIRKMRKGTSEPLYERYLLKALGIERLN